MIDRTTKLERNKVLYLGDELMRGPVRYECEFGPEQPDHLIVVRKGDGTAVCAHRRNLYLTESG